MLKKILVAAAIVAAPMSAFADQDVGCGVGTHLMAGQSGVPAKLLASYTNGILGNGTFGVSSGTLGCNGRDAVSEGRKFQFLSSNFDQFSSEAAAGSGEALSTLAGIYGIDSAADRVAFYELIKSNYTSIFDSATVSSADVIARVDSLMSSNKQLAQYVRA